MDQRIYNFFRIYFQRNSRIDTKARSESQVIEVEVLVLVWLLCALLGLKPLFFVVAVVCISKFLKYKMYLPPSDAEKVALVVEGLPAWEFWWVVA